MKCRNEYTEKEKVKWYQQELVCDPHPRPGSFWLTTTGQMKMQNIQKVRFFWTKFYAFVLIKQLFNRKLIIFYIFFSTISNSGWILRYFSANCTVTRARAHTHTHTHTRVFIRSHCPYIHALAYILNTHIHSTIYAHVNTYTQITINKLLWNTYLPHFLLHITFYVPMLSWKSY